MKYSCFNFKINKVVVFAFCFFIFMSSLLPSGTLLNVPFKHLSFVLFFLIVTICIIIKPINLSGSIFKVLFYLSLLTMLFFYLSYSFFVSNASAEFVLKDFQFISITVASFLLLEITKLVTKFSWKELITPIATASFFGVMLFCLSKTLVIILLLSGTIDYVYVQDVLFKAINYEPVGLSIELVGSRFSFITADMLSVVIYSLIIYKRELFKVDNRIIFIFYLVFTISILSAYSRFLFILIPFFFYLSALLHKKYIKMLIATLIILGIAAYNYELIISIFNSRFLNQGHSDSHRLIMAHELSSNWSDYLLLGSGFGSYVPSYVRSTDLPFSYEMQLLSVFMRFGILPLLVMAAINFVYIKRLIVSFNKDIFYSYMIFFVVILSSMTNQYLFSSQSNVILIIIYLMFISSPIKSLNLNEHKLKAEHYGC